MSSSVNISKQAGQIAATFSISGLAENYGLPQAIQAEWKRSLMPDFTKPFTLTVTTHALCYAVTYRITSIIDFALQLTKEPNELNVPFGNKKFTYLHLTVISSNLEAAEQLLKAKADPDSCDTCDWTPLHHAALSGNAQMIQLFRAYGANQKMTTNMGGTYQDVWNLTHLVSPNPHDKIRLIWQEDGKQSQLTQATFQKLASSVFVEENHIAREHLWKDWNSLTDIQDEFSFTSKSAQKYKEFTKKPSIHILSRVTRDTQGNLLPSSPGLGLFAEHLYEKEQVIGEYQGVIQPNPEYNPYLLFNTSGLTHRNELSHINDGFPNIVCVPIHCISGLPTRRVFITANQIQPGEQFCWNYGLNKCKIRPYAELRPKESRDFIKSENVDELILYLRTTGTSGRLSFEEFVRAEKFRYILETPAVLYTMTLDGTLDSVKAKRLFTISNLMTRMDQNGPKILQNLVEIALECRSLKSRFLPNFPRIAAVYDQYFKAMPATAGILATLTLAQQTNSFLASKLMLIEKERMQSKDTVWDDCDDFFLNLWKTEIIPGIERANLGSKGFR
jgi:hypothetical protein